MSAFAASEATRPRERPLASILYSFVSTAISYIFILFSARSGSAFGGEELNHSGINLALAHGSKLHDTGIATSARRVANGEGIMELFDGIRRSSEARRNKTARCEVRFLAAGYQFFYKGAKFLSASDRRGDFFMHHERTRKGAKERGALSLLSAECSACFVVLHRIS